MIKIEKPKPIAIKKPKDVNKKKERKKGGGKKGSKTSSKSSKKSSASGKKKNKPKKKKTKKVKHSMELTEDELYSIATVFKSKEG